MLVSDFDSDSNGILELHTTVSVDSNQKSNTLLFTVTSKVTSFNFQKVTN